MPRLIAVVLSLLGLSLAFAAPVPKHLMKDAPPFYPTTVGTKLVYDSDGREQTRVVAKVEVKDGGTLVTTEAVDADGNRRLFHKALVNAKGVFFTEAYGSTYDPPLEVLRLPFKANARWGGIENRRSGEVRTATKEEIVKVAAGEFKCIRVEAESPNGGGKSIHWYAAGVFVVKIDYGNNSTLVLKSITSGKN